MKKFAFAVLVFGYSFCVYGGPVADPGSRGIDWDAVRAKVAKDKRAQDLVKGMEGQVRGVMGRYDHPPLGKTGWFHDYFCEDDAQRLKFDPDKPKEHVCTGCGRVYRGTPYDDCWRSSVQGEITRAAAQAGILYRVTGKKEYLGYARKVLLWYAENYDKFEVQGAHAGKGRIREQSLDEATQLVIMAQAYWDICADLSEGDRKVIAEGYLLPDARFIHTQTRTIHNIHSWHNGAVGLVGFAIGDEGLVKAAIDGKYGLKEQIRRGVKSDGFWFEGSISYHFYTIGSLQPLYMAAKGQGYSLEGTDKFRLMYTAPIDFTFDNGEFPANNDGWPGGRLDGRASYYEFAAGLWGDLQVVKLLNGIYLRGGRPGLNALLNGPVEITAKSDETSGSVLFKDSGIAMLRNDSVNAYLKFGPYGGGHDHNDRLNMILYARGEVIVPDLGTSGYGISLNGKWFRTSAAHNMVVVDGRRQANCGGYLVSYEDDAVVAGVKDAYKGVDIRRRVSLLEDGIEDEVSVESEGVHEYDLFYHVRGKLKSCSFPLSAVEPFKRSNGYNMLRGLQKGNCDGRLEISWTLRDVAGELKIECESGEEFEFYVGTCPDNPANKEMSFLMLRRKGSTARWKSRLVVD